MWPGDSTLRTRTGRPGASVLMAAGGSRQRILALLDLGHLGGELFDGEQALEDQVVRDREHAALGVGVAEIDLAAERLERAAIFIKAQNLLAVEQDEQRFDALFP